ncbi:restriction endonuclease subunit S [Metamycoplasma sualvi]|uniref:restriction endonuclease subunit S n=1 Tax=Metamycoplasma sualvi TaxID=2125 RepID=UPI003872AA1D
MAIKEYILEDIFSSKPEYGCNLPSRDKGDIKYLTQSELDCDYKKINRWLIMSSSIKKFALKKGDFLMSRAGTIKSYYHSIDEPLIFAGYLVRYNFNKSILLHKYLYYWTKSTIGLKTIDNLSKTGTTMPKLNPPIFKKIKIKLPNIKIQQQIINIIEPFERLKNKINNIMEYLKMITLIQINNFNLPTDTSLKIFNNIQGYSFKSSDFKNKGQYKIFKISNILNNNEKNFSYTDNIVLKHLLKCGDVVTGLSGTIGTSCVIYENNMYILNQRLLAINSNIPLLIKMLIEKNKKILEQSSTGSVQKNITKNDILNIKLNSKLINKFNELISKLYILNLKISNVIDVIINNLVNLYII